MLSVALLILLWRLQNTFKGWFFKDFYDSKLMFCLLRKALFADLADTAWQAIIRRYFTQLVFSCTLISLYCIDPKSVKSFFYHLLLNWPSFLVTFLVIVCKIEIFSTFNFGFAQFLIFILLVNSIPPSGMVSKLK